MQQFPNTVFRLHFCFLIEKLARGKNPPVSLLTYINGSTDFFLSTRKMLSKRANNFDVFFVQYIQKQAVPHCLIRNLNYSLE